jgi:hypothetical protein
MYTLVVSLDLFCGLGPCWLTETHTGLDPSGDGLPRGTSAIGWFVHPPYPRVLVVFSLALWIRKEGGSLRHDSFDTTKCTQ